MGSLRFFLGYGIAVLVMAATPGAIAAEPKPPVVVELFTSQGCNSCPPADAYLASLKGRDNVIALSYHVNYWDYLGWRDTLASDTTTQRQRDYARTLGERTIYTPQIVVGGRYHEVGSRHTAVDRTIRKVALEQDENLLVQLSEAPRGTLQITIAKGQIYHRRVVVWLVIFDPYHEVKVERGENGGRTLGSHNVVRDMREIGEWYGKEFNFALNIDDLRTTGEAVAVIVQEHDSGHILGAQASQLAGLSRP
ncbi:MAG: DUF1223 domain-containing protein [Alphaproteobacteria bacterium]|nr:DUF1223 domain-containing protein [Alphaproteobacteria bacterium]